MSLRITFRLAACACALVAVPAVAQQTIEYEAGEYEYAQPSPELDDDVVTEPAPQPDDRRGGERGPIYIRSEVVQTTDGVSAPSVRRPGPVGAAGPIYIRRPGNGLLHTVAAPVVLDSVASVQSRLPAGSRIVAFDRNVWLTECAARLDTYANDAERHAALRALGGTGVSPFAAASPGSWGQCQAYLDGYLHGAGTQGWTPPYASGAEYMLVPVTVMVPQRAVYRDQVPAD